MKTLIFASILAASTCAYSAPVTHGQGTGLSPAQLRKLRAAGLHLALPTYVPGGYKVTEVSIDLKGGRKEATVMITWRRGKSEIWFQEASEGLGDLILPDNDGGPESSGAYTFRSALVGKGPVNYVHVKGVPEWGVDWQSLPGKNYPRSVSARGSKSDPREGLLIMESIRWFK